MAIFLVLYNLSLDLICLICSSLYLTIPCPALVPPGFDTTLVSSRSFVVAVVSNSLWPHGLEHARFPVLRAWYCSFVGPVQAICMKVVWRQNVDLWMVLNIAVTYRCLIPACLALRVVPSILWYLLTVLSFEPRVCFSPNYMNFSFIFHHYDKDLIE